MSVCIQDNIVKKDFEVTISTFSLSLLFFLKLYAHSLLLQSSFGIEIMYIICLSVFVTMPLHFGLDCLGILGGIFSRYSEK